MSLNRYKLRHLAQTKTQGRPPGREAAGQADRLLGLILIGNNLVNILASAIATIVCIRLFGDPASPLPPSADPGGAGIRGSHPQDTGGHVPRADSLPIPPPDPQGADGAVHPLVWLINSITNLLLKLLRLEHNKDDSLNSEELRTIVNEAGNLFPSTTRRC